MVLHDLTSRRRVPGARVVLGSGAVAALLVGWGRTWPAARVAVTTVHEAGHALVALLVGRRLAGVRVHQDASGLTLSRGRSRGPGLVAVYLAGYLAPAVVGALAAVALAAGRPAALLWGVVLGCLLLLPWLRNGYGLLVVVALGAAAAGVGWAASPRVETAVAYLLAWVLLLGAPRPAWELLRAGPARARGSDAVRLAALTRVPATAWALLFLLANLAGLAWGAATLAPVLLERLP